MDALSAHLEQQHVSQGQKNIPANPGSNDPQTTEKTQAKRASSYYIVVLPADCDQRTCIPAAEDDGQLWQNEDRRGATASLRHEYRNEQNCSKARPKANTEGVWGKLG